jgi:hypothetical protein
MADHDERNPQADSGRWKRVIGEALHSQADGRQATEVAIAVGALNRMLELGRPNYIHINETKKAKYHCGHRLIRATRCRASLQPMAAQGPGVDTGRRSFAPFAVRDHDRVGYCATVPRPKLCAGVRAAVSGPDANGVYLAQDLAS